jgi:hypothetical protein
MEREKGKSQIHGDQNEAGRSISHAAPTKTNQPTSPPVSVTGAAGRQLPCAFAPDPSVPVPVLA